MRFVVDNAGRLSIAGDDMLFINVNQEARAVEFLVMQPRYQEEPLEGLFAGKKVHVNLGLIPKGGEDWRTRLSDALFVIVGTATLAAPDEAPA